MPKLMIYHGNWADEMDLDGWIIMSEEACHAYMQRWEQGEYPVEISYGTNEEMYIPDYEYFRECWNFVSIDNDTTERLKILFGGIMFGFIPPDYDETVLIEDDDPDDYDDEGVRLHPFPSIIKEYTYTEDPLHPITVMYNKKRVVQTSNSRIKWVEEPVHPYETLKSL